MMTPILTLERSPVNNAQHQKAFDTPHRPDTTSTRYTLWTEHHDRETADLNPCAVKLYRWLLERAAGGIEQEVDLEEFQYSTISQKREKGYHIKHILRSFSSLLTAGFVIVTRSYTKRVMRLVVRHAGLLKPIQLGQKSSQRNQQVPQRTDLFQSKRESIEIASPIQSSSEFTQTSIAASETADANIGSGEEEELEEVQAAISDAPFMQDALELESSPPLEPSIESKFDAPDSRTTLERLRTLGIPLTTDVRSLVAKTPDSQLERNVLALEEAATTKGLKSPIAAFKYFITNNCQPRLSGRQSWWNRATSALGKERRDGLIQAVFEYAGEEVVMFTSGRRLSLAQAQLMSWEALAALGEST